MNHNILSPTQHLIDQFDQFYNHILNKSRILTWKVIQFVYYNNTLISLNNRNIIVLNKYPTWCEEL